MKYYRYMIDMEKKASFKLSPIKKFKSLSLGKKIGVGVGVASTGAGVVSSVGGGVKELTKPMQHPTGINTGFQYGTMSVNTNTGMDKKAGAEHDSLESSKMKYLPIVAGVTTGGVIAGGIATGKLNKDLFIQEGKKVAKRASKAYNVGAKIVNDAAKIAKGNKKNQELKEAFDIYRQKTKNTLMEFDDYKELRSAYESVKRKTGDTTLSFEDWAKRNARRIGMQNKKYYKKTDLKEKANMALDATIKGAALGTATSLANFAVHEAGDEYFRKKDRDEVRARFREDWNNNFTDNLVAGKRAQRGKKTGYKTPKQRIDNYNKQMSRNNNYKPKNINKTASAPMGEFVNHADDMIQSGVKKLKGKALVKDIIKNDVIKSGVTGVAFVGAPAVAAASMKRDRNTFNKIEDNKTDKIVMDIPESVMKKKASYTDKVIKGAKKIKKDYIPENLGQDFVRAGIRGISMAAPVAAVAHATNRNLRGNLEELEDRNKKLKPVDKGNIRVTLERRVD